MNVALRPVIFEDAQQIYEWQNIPNIRFFFRNPSPPKWEEHIQWLSNSLQDQSKYLFLITCDSQPGGLLHLTRIENITYEISIIVAPEWQGKGVAKEALFNVRKLFPFLVIQAEINSGNTVSQNLFLSCGYIKKGTDTYLNSPVEKSLSCVIRANSGVGVGLGHLRRCLELSKVLRDNHWSVFFVEPPESNAIQLIEHTGFSTIIVNDESESICRSAVGARLLLIDHYELDIQTFASFSERTWKLAVFDDLGNRLIPVDVVINGSPSAQNMNFSRLGAEVVLAGPEYQVIRDDLIHLKPEVDIESPKSILVTIGAGDPHHLLETLILLFEKNFCHFGMDIRFNIIVGPQVKESYVTNNEAISIHYSPDNMAELISTSDIAVSASGQTLMELLFVGVPTVALCLADNQIENIQALESEKCIISAGRVDKNNWEETLVSSLVSLLEDVSLRQKLSINARRMIDGKGAERIVSKFLEKVGDDKAISE
jgi:UDP-2,4-diacetamido-2,4,6-trideoxy-beta-L-altropyranose hydrolase